MLRAFRDPVSATSGTRSRSAVAIALAVTVFLVLTLLIGSTADEEEFRFAVLSAWLHVNALRHGSLGLWTPLLGLGVPQPFVPNFLLHPLLPLLAVVSPVTWARVLLATHTLVGALGMWQLTRYLSLAGIVRAACVATFLLATPAQNYALSDFWPSHYLVWTAAPWIVLLAWRLLEADPPQRAFRSVALGLSLGLVTANTNPGHILVYSLLAGAILVTRWRAAVSRWRWLILTGLIAAALALPNIVQLAREEPLFPRDLRFGLGDQDQPLPAAAAWNAFVSPFAIDTGELLFTRTLFFGGPFALLALAGCVRCFRRHLDLSLVLVVGTVLLFTTFVPLPLVSARFHIRDPLTLSAVLLAGLFLNRLATTPGREWLARSIVLVQLVVIVAAAWPALRLSWSENARRAAWFRGATGDVPAIDSLVRLAQPSGRMVFTPSLDEDVIDNRRVEEGLGTNGLAYRRLPILNGWFKGVSGDVISPDERLFYGRVASTDRLVESTLALSVLGIRWVLASEDDAVAPELRKTGAITLSNDVQLTLYENTSVWPAGFLVKAEAANLRASKYGDCENDRLLCADIGALASYRLPDAVATAPRANGFDVRLTAAGSPRVLVLSQMYRRDWVATDGGAALATVPILRGLLGVRIPPDVTSVEIRYRPVAIIGTLVVAWLTIAAAIVALVVLRRRLAVPDNGDA